MVWRSRTDRIAMTGHQCGLGVAVMKLLSDLGARKGIRAEEQETATHHLLNEVWSDELVANVKDRSEGVLVSDRNKVPSQLLCHADLLRSSSSLERIAP